MNYHVLGLGVLLMLAGGLLIGVEGSAAGPALLLTVGGLALTAYTAFSGSTQRMSGEGRRIKDNWV
ncbi:MAG TPA: hypothetical protein VFG68_16165 [Fimbriiglobus sp.]|nr:hypothetical protein [Fimbriiglobus sp.]